MGGASPSPTSPSRSRSNGEEFLRRVDADRVAPPVPQHLRHLPGAAPRVEHTWALADEVDEHADHVPVHRELRNRLVLERIGIALGAVVVADTRVLVTGLFSTSASHQSML